MPRTQILITPAELQSVLPDPGWVVIDCRSELADPDAGRRAYEAGHITGSVFLDLDRDLAGPVLPSTGRHPLPDVSRLSRTLGELGVGNTHSVVVYDNDNGALAARAWWALRWLGHVRVFLLDGGIANWKSAGLVCDAVVPVRAPCEYAATADPSKILTTAELAVDVAGIGNLNLLDARDAARYRGEQEPIDPIAGHIPGTVNAPYTEFVNSNGTWRPLAERAALLEQMLGKDRDITWSVMCGSGVTACHLAISGVEAGYLEPRLYVGSWSEWIRDPERPIGTGNG